jgi:GNAT superfamily N-acetyltransferase
MQELAFINKTGVAIESVFDDLARLRIEVFRAYPYLYEGSIAYEKEYLKIYSSSEKAFLCAVYDGLKMVGATTCIPLIDETNDVKEPFIRANLSLENIFYFGESILLPAYRGMGIGHRFFDEREAYAKSFEETKFTCFCSVVRPENHPLRPALYKPLDDFWEKRGYDKVENLKSQFEWMDIGEEKSTKKEMAYWMRKLDNQ